jgi:UDP-N-acetylglucosamine 4,6-dehydratase/5-epimerase
LPILITGGAGFLGRGIMKYGPDVQYVVYSRDETKQDICKRMYPRAEYVLGDIEDPVRLDYAVKRYHVDTIIHAAAIKYIPEAELNVNEAIAVNVDGARVVCEIAVENGVERVVGISTDKAVMPVNVYGATKMLLERLFAEWANVGYFTLTRYGNVVGSTGSVIPLFERQLAQTGVLTLTNKNMTRFWLSIKQAVELVELALTAPNGHIVVPYASAMTMGHLAETLAGTRGRIDVIGTRPGEKQHEDMVQPYESIRVIDGKDSFLIQPVGSEACHAMFAYGSDAPRAWMSNTEMLEAIEMAKGV